MDKVAFVRKVADKLRGTFKQHEYGRKISGQGFDNTSLLTFATLLNDDKNLADNLAV